MMGRLKYTVMSICFMCLFVTYISSFAEENKHWFPRTRTHDLEAATIPKDAELTISFPKDAPFHTKGDLTTKDGAFVPEESKYTVSGAIESSIGQFKKRAEIKSWTFIYSDSSKKKIVGYGACLVSGEILLPIDALAVVSDDDEKRYVENSFLAEDFGDRFLLIKLNPTEHDSLCIHLRFGGGMNLTTGYPGTKIRISNKVFVRKAGGWYLGNKLVGK